MKILKRTLPVYLMLAVSAPASAAQTNAPQAPRTAIRTEQLAEKLVNPWALQELPDGRFLITERPGRMRLSGPGAKSSEPIAGLPNVVNKGQGGLLDVRLAEDFASSGQVFFAFSEPGL